MKRDEWGWDEMRFLHLLKGATSERKLSLHGLHEAGERTDFCLILHFPFPSVTVEGHVKMTSVKPVLPQSSIFESLY